MTKLTTSFLWKGWTGFLFHEEVGLLARERVFGICRFTLSAASPFAVHALQRSKVRNAPSVSTFIVKLNWQERIGSLQQRRTCFVIQVFNILRAANVALVVAFSCKIRVLFLRPAVAIGDAAYILCSATLVGETSKSTKIDVVWTIERISLAHFCWVAPTSGLSTNRVLQVDCLTGELVPGLHTHKLEAIASRIHLEVGIALCGCSSESAIGGRRRPRERLDKVIVR
mmetsp:Transcript_32695/g.54035  ORF Transcript_32695/g.54035 Transcript_32695/m.54035 type:complete len:227 (+) Transcript_32695:248-928(+)